MGYFSDLVSQKTLSKKVVIPQYAKPVFDSNLKISAPTGKSLTLAELPEKQRTEYQAQIREVDIAKGKGEGFFATLVRAPFKAAQAVALDYMKPEGGSQFVPQTNFEKLIFGEAPVKSLSRQYTEAEQTLEGGGYGKTAPIIAGVAAFGGAVLDLTPFGGSRKTLANQVVKTITREGAETLLRKMGVSDDLVRVFADNVVSIKNIDEAEKLLRNIEKVQSTTKVASKVVSQDPLAQEAKSIVEKGGTLNRFDEFNNVTIKKVPENQIRNKGVGDYYMTKDGGIEILVSDKLGDVDFKKTAIHELVEASLAKKNRVSFEAINKFDAENIKSPQPGELKNAPYHKEHLLANEAEKLFSKTETELPNIKPKVIRDEAKIAELKAQKETAQLKKEITKEVFDTQTESNYQQFKNSIGKFKEIPEDAPQYKLKTGRGVETDNLLYSQELNEDEMYRKFLDRFESDKKIANDLAKLQAELREVKGKAIKDYTSEQLARINAITQDITSFGKRESLPVAKTLKEFQSTAGQADQALSKFPEVMRQKVSSLPDIIAQSVKDVKKKVNVIDYLRTPDRVLSKIGLDKEAKMLQEGYNAYVKELPKNIDKITDWSKQVQKESAENIFKYLDGQKITLNETELKVANEIKDWLKDWAKRLKLPEDRTITKYITHIFDKELIAKEFDEDLAKIITDKVPGSVYDPFLLERLGAKGYKQNVWEALDAYVKRGTRKANMDDALEAIQKAVGSSLETSKVDVSAFKYIQKYISGVNMRPTELDNLIDNSVKSLVGYKFGQRPVTYLTKVLRQMTYRGMLGLNVSSALRNISQGINTYAQLGEKYTAIGYTNLFKKGAMRELAEEGVLLDNFIQDRTLSSTKKAIEKMDKVLFSFFQGAEKINRGAAYFGAKSKALAKGKTLEEAKFFAKETVRKTQFTFGSVDTPVALQSDIVKTIAQFQNFTLKQTEFLAEMVKDKNFVGLIRYAVGGLAFTYTIGKLFGMKPEQLIPNFRFDTPPSLKLPVEAGKAILNAPDKFGNKRDLGEKVSDVLKSAIGLIPAGIQGKKTIEGLKSILEGGSYTKSGNLQFKQGESLAEKAQSVIFGKYASQNARDYFADITVAEKELEALNKLLPQEANSIMKRYKESNPSLYRSVKKLKEDEVLGITDEDKKIREMGVENQERAKYILKEAKKLKTVEEKNAYIKELRKKKVITDEVLKQLKQLKGK